MATQATIELVGAVLKQLDDVRALEERLGEHFGYSSDVGTLASRARQGLLGVLIGIAHGFKDGLSMKSGELYRLGQLFAIPDTLEDLNTISRYLEELTDRVVLGISAHGETYRMVFDRELLNTKK